MPTFPEQGGSNNTWGTELRNFFAPYFNLTTGDANVDALVPTDSLTSDKIKDGAITTNKIANNAVEESKILNSAVTANKIASNAVIEEKILDSAVTTNKIANDAVTTSKILNGAITAEKLDIGAVIIPDASITNSKLATDAVTADKILNATITSGKLASGASIDNIASGAITSEKFAPGAVDSNAIATSAIINDKILNGTIGPEKLSFVVDVSGGTGLVAVVSGTYAELLTKVSEETLTPGQKYLMTDFQTIHTILNTSVLNTASIEPLMLTALTNNTFEPIAFSQTYPTDVIFYEIISTSQYDIGVSYTKGRIYRRIDKQGNDMPEDFRGMLNRRWESTNGSGIYDSLTDTGFNYEDSVTFKNYSQSWNNKFPAFVANWYTGTGVPRNVVFNGTANDNIFYLDAYNLTFLSSITTSFFGPETFELKFFNSVNSSTFKSLTSCNFLDGVNNSYFSNNTSCIWQGSISNSTFENCNSMNYTTGFNNIISKNTFNNLTTTVDISDISNVYPSEELNITVSNTSIYYITSVNSIEYIKYINFSSPNPLPVKIVPEIGLKLILLNTGNIRIPTSFLEIDGTNGDWIEASTVSGNANVLVR